MTHRLTRRQVEAYAARHGQQVEFAPAVEHWSTDMALRALALREQGHTPRLYLTCIDGDELLTAVTYIPAPAAAAG